MLFLALLSYLLLFPAICLILGVLWPEVSGMMLAVPTGIASLLLAAKLGRVAEIYAPGLKRPLRLLVRREGMRWLCALTVIAFAGAMVWQIAFHGRLHGWLPIAIAIPAVVVFGLNWIGIDLPIRGLEAETKPDLVNIPPPPEGPAQPDSPMSPEAAPPVAPSAPVRGSAVGRSAGGMGAQAVPLELQRDELHNSARHVRG